jgi:hypothetical protein
MLYQQGDVLISKIDKVKGKKLNHCVLAEGEVTGHCHQVTQGEAELYQHEGTLFLRVKSDECTVTHEEHSKVVLPRGDYQIEIVKEYDHFSEEIRNVKD